MELITSKSNSKIKLAMSLHNKKGRDKTGLFIIEGLRFVSDALSSLKSSDFEFVIYSTEKLSKDNAKEVEELVRRLEMANVKCYSTLRSVAEALSATESPQGIVAVLNKSSLISVGAEEEDGAIHNRDLKRIIILDKIKDPGNLGTIIRTADSAGFDGIILMKGTVDYLSPKVLRSTMGSIFNIFIMDDAEMKDVINFKNMGINILSAALDGAVFYNELDYGEKFAIVIGNEAFGVSEEILSISDSKVKIPIYGGAESLNAAIAAGILMYKSRE